jgi:hypothetical protein
MGLFDKLFGNGAEEPQTLETLGTCTSAQELLERYGGISLEKQHDLGEVIGDGRWSVDINKGEISFGPDLNFPIQVLGTFSESSRTWLWAWENVQSQLPENLLQHALQLKSYGEEHGIDRFTVGKLDADGDDPHFFGLIASGMFNASGYYVADYEGGSMAATLKSDKVESLRRHDHGRSMIVFSQLISQFQMNHKHALASYMLMKGYTVTASGNRLTATRGGDKVEAKFDKNARLKRFDFQ